jgi:tRNA (guanosine-2'-O-)-methyltransferase
MTINDHAPLRFSTVFDWVSATEVRLGGRVYPVHRVNEAVAGLLTPERRARIRQVVARRNFSFVPVLENVHDMGNISAAMRSAEAFGFGEFHIVEYANRKFKPANRVTNGCEKWLEIRAFSSPQDCLAELRQRGFQIFATKLSATARDLESVDFGRPTAVVLGNERDGVSEAMAGLCDGDVVIPMRGFTQSFNISVAASLAFFHASRETRRISGRDNDLTAVESQFLELEYMLRSLSHPHEVLSRLLEV